MNKLYRILGLTAGTLAVIAAVSQAPSMSAEASSGKYSSKNVIVTETKADKNTVTVTVSQTKAKRVSSGKITIFYDDDALTLSDETPTNKYDVVDVNTNAGKNGDGGISVAFSDRSAKKKDRDLLTASFKVNSKSAGKDVAVSLVVDELYNEDDSVYKAGTETKLDVKTEPIEKWVGQVSKLRISRNTREVKLTYGSVEDAEGYEIFRADAKDNNFQKIMTTDKNKVYDKASKLKNGHTYLYKVRAYEKIDGSKVYGDFSSVKSVKIPTYKGFFGAIGWIWDSIHW